MDYLDNIVFAIILGLGFGYFYLNIKKLVRNINLGIAVDRNDNSKARWSNMAMIALGQSKMVKRPVAGFFHIIVYVGFVIINFELLEIIIDGLFGTHRIFAFLGSIYDLLIASFEILAVLIVSSCSSKKLGEKRTNRLCILANTGWTHIFSCCSWGYAPTKPNPRPNLS